MAQSGTCGEVIGICVIEAFNSNIHAGPSFRHPATCGGDEHSKTGPSSRMSKPYIPTAFCELLMGFIESRCSRGQQNYFVEVMMANIIGISRI